MQVSGFSPRACNQTTPGQTANGAVTAAVTQINLPGAPYVSETIARFITAGSNTSNVISWAYGAQSGLTATNGCIQLCNTVEIFTIPAGITQISVIAGATGTTLYIIIGDGL